jgi:electron transport complex protein RnfG
MAKGVGNPSYRKRTAYQAALLGGMALFASAALVLGDLSTRDAIAERRAEDLKASLAQVVPVNLHDNDMLADTLSLPDGQGERLFYRARLQGRTTAVAFQTIGYGYSGAIVLVMGVDRDGRVLGVRVISHAETPGLGDRIELTKSEWIRGFDRLSLGDPPPAAWAVKKDGGRFDQFTGATITPRAVVGAVRAGLEFFNAHRDVILADEPTALSERTP